MAQQPPGAYWQALVSTAEPGQPDLPPTAFTMLELAFRVVAVSDVR
jgi:hypothetical protein